MKKAKIVYSKIIPNQKQIIDSVTLLGYEAYFYQESNKEEEMAK